MARPDAAPGADDSEPLDGETRKEAPRLRFTDFKVLAALFVWFMVVVSDFFVDNVLGRVFGQSSVEGRSPSTWGVVIQGVFVVLGLVALSFLSAAEYL